MDQPADIVDRDRIDAGERLVQQQVFRIGREAAGDFHPPPLAARQRQRRRAAQMGDGKLRQEFLQPLAPLVAVRNGDLEDRQDVVLDREAAKDRHFLRQIADAKPGPAIHRQPGHVAPVDQHLTAIGRDQPGDVVKAGGLARPVGAKQCHHLAARQIQRHVADHRPAAIALAQVDDPQPTTAFGQFQIGGWRHHGCPVCRTVRTRPSIRPVPSLMFTVKRSPATVLPVWVRSTSPVKTTVSLATV